MHRLLLLILLIVAGCGDPSAVEQSAVEAAAFELMTDVSLSEIDDAFNRLDGLAYTVRLTVEELDLNEQTLATVSRTVRRLPSADGVVETVIDSEFSASVSDTTALEGPRRPVNPISKVLSEEPAYISARTRDRYTYEMRADSMVDGERLRVVQATLHRDQVDSQPIRYARYYITDANSLVAVDVLRVTESSLFSEDSHVTVWLQRYENGALLPQITISETTIQTPGGDPKHLRLTQTIEDIAAIE